MRVAGRTGRNFWLVALLLMVVAGMGTTVSYSVTLYRLFCAVTGAGGTTRRVAGNDATRSARTVRVFFSTNVAPNLPWRFVPMQPSITLHLGEDAPVYFEAENLSDHDIVGRATFNVTPDKSGIYFKKIECFCFTEEKLAAHQRVQMPVDFFVDPALAEDPATSDVDQITLSYSFFQARDASAPQDLARFVADPAAGAREFASQCGACHLLEGNKIGPSLGGVAGRRAGAVAGYGYSKALAESGVVWSEATLERWLAGPRAFVPGALMPMAVADPRVRRDIVAYLMRQGGS